MNVTHRAAEFCLITSAARTIREPEQKPLHYNALVAGVQPKNAASFPDDKTKIPIAFARPLRKLWSMPVFLRIMVGFVVLACLATHANAGTNVIKTQVEIAPKAERVRFFFNAKTHVIKHFALQNPPRIVIDVPHIQSGDGVGLSPSYNGKMIKNIRFGHYNPQVSRFVLDLSAMTAPPKVFTVAPQGDQPWQLVIDLGDGSAVADAKPDEKQPGSAKEEAKKPEPAKKAAVKTEKPEKSAKNADQVPSGEEFGATPAKNAKSKAGLVEPKLPIIVIDAGHGGKDTGAFGHGGVMEKDVTLQYARALRTALLNSGRYRVALTRDDDRFLFLKERVTIARNYNADLFISIHADSNPNPVAEGLSVYTVSEQASDEESAALAAQENGSDVIGGVELGREDKVVADILLDLAQRETKAKSAKLADHIITSMDPKIPLITNPHRFAGFRVLKGPDVPSVLVEIGFLTNGRDEQKILSREYRDKIARSVVGGIDAYFGRPTK